MNFFITGTDTGVGKTYVTKVLLESLRADGYDAVGYKPVACGDRDDAYILAAASGDLPVEEVNPLWLATPAAPWVAAKLENRSIFPQDLIDGYRKLADEHEIVLVEGAGGWEVPITENFSMSDLAAVLNIPVCVVVANRLGAINHSVLTCKAIQARGITLAGIILNHLVDELDIPMIANKSTIPALAKTPLLCEIIHQQDWVDHDWITEQ